MNNRERNDLYRTIITETTTLPDFAWNPDTMDIDFKYLEAQEAAIGALGYDFVLYTGKPYIRRVALYKSKNHNIIERSEFCENFPSRLAALDWILKEKNK